MAPQAPSYTEQVDTFSCNMRQQSCQVTPCLPISDFCRREADFAKQLLPWVAPGWTGSFVDPPPANYVSLNTIAHWNCVAGVHLASGAFLLGIGSESGAGPSPYPHDAAAVSAMAVKARHWLWFSNLWGINAKCIRMHVKGSRELICIEWICFEGREQCRMPKKLQWARLG